MTSRGSAVERSTLEALKFAVPKSLEDIVVVVMVEETFWLSSDEWNMWTMRRRGKMKRMRRKMRWPRRMIMVELNPDS